MKIEFSNLGKATKDLGILILIFQIVLIFGFFLSKSLAFLKIGLFIQLFLLVVLYIIQKFSNKYENLFDDLNGKANKLMNGEN